MTLLVNRFPSEFLQKVSTHLSVQDCWHATLVCRSWHHTFQRALYKKVFIYSDKQLQQLVASISHHGYLVKELHLISTRSHESTTLQEDLNHVLLDQDTLLTLHHLCPLLEVLRFDPSQWIHLQLPDHLQWTQMRQCGMIHYTNFTPTFLTFFGSNLTQLHMTHAAHDLETLVDRLRIPTLKELRLEMIVEVENEMIFTTTHSLERLHANLPQLVVFHFMRNKTPHHETVPAHDLTSSSFIFAHPTAVRTLTLHGHVDSIQWFQFISINYPLLETLELTQISTSRFGTKWIWQTALIDLIRSLPCLQRLCLGGKNIPQLFSKALLVELNSNTQINEFNIDFQTYQAIESCQFLLSLASNGLASLRHLSLRVWEQIPGWSGVTKNLFQCQGLVSLQLWFSKGFMDQFPFTSFYFDHFLIHLPRLKKLALTGAHVQVMYKQDQQVLELEELFLVQCKIEHHDRVFQYISNACPQLNILEFSKCESERLAINKSHLLNEWTMDLHQIQLKRLVLSSILIYVGTVQTNDFIGIQINGRIRWCSTIKSMIYPEYGLCDDTEKNLELDKVYQSYTFSKPLEDRMPGNYTPTLGVLVIHCPSLTQLYLDNLKIPI